MNLLQVRKGQFVYYKNELHKVYSVRPLSRLSIKLFRIKDMEQVNCRADELTLHRPQHLDSLIFQGVRYTLRKDKPAKVDGYILITHPDPGQLDHYTLNEFEKVGELVGDKVYTTLYNTVKPKEFLVLEPGEAPDSKVIDYLDPSLVTAEQLEADRELEEKAVEEAAKLPSVGDIYLNLDNGIKAMVVALVDNEAILGHGERVKSDDLFKSDSWNVIYSTGEEDF
ncbi:hypothetical protein [Sporosarcina jiandibaonis]|uniref:hypothetical protein n=1 Tax=Sporosarcina jiandibaonis TaxID=2715535 RepID=UPI001552D1B4|nr:hypothetical protein [Sporosarcina jiandibaonis]